MSDTELISLFNNKTKIEYFEKEGELTQESPKLETVSNCDLSYDNVVDDIESHFAVAVFKHERNLFTGKSYSYIFFHVCQPTSYISSYRFILRQKMEMGNFIGFRKLERDLISKSDLHHSLIRISYLYNNPASSRNIKYEYKKFIKKIMDRKSRNLVGLANRLTKTDFIRIQGNELKINENQIDSGWFWSTIHKNVTKIDEELMETVKSELSKKIKLEHTLDYYWVESE